MIPYIIHVLMDERDKKGPSFIRSTSQVTKKKIKVDAEYTGVVTFTDETF